MMFFYLHLAAVAAWVPVNLGALPGVQPFAPNFVVLAIVASLSSVSLNGPKSRQIGTSTYRKAPNDIDSEAVLDAIQAERPAG
jgi:hypothetical protein